ncbi:nickel-responsive transcriptional regulator NikR [candidate division KSB1 bacterium]|nr:nickel-responsive transcriptional regulator NikR [Candidatus Bathyarchaeota archaeon]NIV95405.1 nickel-responsive transcriptional regulator NikR [candidate division KSB1 bacterium]
MTEKQSVARFSVSLPSSLVHEFDGVWRSMGYMSRSKAAHDAFRGFISEFKLMSERVGQIIGAIVLLYYVDKPGLLNQIMHVQHRFEDVISSSMHVHLAQDKCLEVIAVRGNVKEIKRLAHELATKKGVKQLKFTVMTP